jgi:pyruvate dehydrogenase E1 component
MGATSGRTTLEGEGLQHQDGHSHMIAANVPNCVAYDPTYAYELAVIVHDGMRRMLSEQEDVFYYVTITNESYAMPAMPEGAAEGIVRGMYLLKEADASKRTKATKAKKAPKTSKGKQPALRAQLLGSGAILREVLAAAELLASDWGVQADVWSVTSFTELRRDGERCAREAMWQPTSEPEASYVEQCLASREGPVIAATDYVKLYADQIRAFVPAHYVVLGTDGFGRSDTREALRSFFEVDRRHVVVATLKALADEGALATSKVRDAIGKYGVDAKAPDPRLT